MDIFATDAQIKMRRSIFSKFKICASVAKFTYLRFFEATFQSNKASGLALYVEILSLTIF